MSVLEKIIGELESILTEMEQFRSRYASILASVDKRNIHRAYNLIDYMAFRCSDRSDLQQRLAQLGLSSLGRSEAAIQPQILRVKALVEILLGRQVNLQTLLEEDPVSQGRYLLEHHCNRLFGPTPEGRHTRIMVTMPDEAARNLHTVKQLLEGGMGVARINCAHGTSSEWRRMADNIRKACLETGLSCSILMDLAGPKLRTGPMPPGEKVVKVKVLRDPSGHIMMPGKAIFYSQDVTPKTVSNTVSVPILLNSPELCPGIDHLLLKDARGKQRRFNVIHQSQGMLTTTVDGSAYLATGLEVVLTHGQGKLLSRIGELPCKESYLSLQEGDLLRLVSDNVAASHAVLDEDGNLLHPASLSCGVPEALAAPEIGHRIKMDDGKFTGIVEGKSPGSLLLRITEAPGGGGKLRAEKGINFPDTDLPISGLTSKDIQDLDTICELADLIALSFVNTRTDVDDLIHELKIRNRHRSIGLVLKIETRHAFNNLPELLLSAMQSREVGVMIARGDLGVEVGWRQMAEIQEEILWLCAAAHIPTIWATQVLESLAKTGQPTRSEITDAAMAQRAECVMLNKGPYIHKAIKMLARIIRTMDARQYKKSARLPKLACRYPDVDKREQALLLGQV
ncbi:hypothetical protein BTA51_20185 [Hahella sp. CCB-MM4]|uniref:pyruvate kinase n=1 Tax=Hahella sp. (strain CCB-MM4) TaxID=1926491 RepID=UPI000B9B28B4|nr:pyruvate kinase [Hahella sp. CCB-MM4]OZG71600.1 hypothetical protein BTA51_20185 [Hahella sp. CCB-MM4]